MMTKLMLLMKVNKILGGAKVSPEFTDETKGELYENC